MFIAVTISVDYIIDIILFWIVEKVQESKPIQALCLKIN